LGWSRFGSFSTAVRTPFGFSWPRAGSPRKPHLSLLDYLGFPWILSSESRFINGLCGINAQKFFLGASSMARVAGTGADGQGRAEGQDCSSGKLTSVSDFPQIIVVRRLPTRSSGLGGKPSSMAAHHRNRLAAEADIWPPVWTGNSHRHRSLSSQVFRAWPAASYPVSCWDLRSPQPTGCIRQYTPVADHVPCHLQGQSPCTSHKV
jgi:hypothetical protein